MKILIPLIFPLVFISMLNNHAETDYFAKHKPNFTEIKKVVI
jgi:hypothetical protein